MIKTLSITKYINTKKLIKYSCGSLLAIPATIINIITGNLDILGYLCAFNIIILICFVVEDINKITIVKGDTIEINRKEAGLLERTAIAGFFVAGAGYCIMGLLIVWMYMFLK